MNKKILVIGGSGFLGSHVADAFSVSGYKVTIFDNKKSKWIRKDQEFILGDILDEKKINDSIKSKNIVLNFAGISDLSDAYFNGVNVTKYNVLSNSIILESCQKNKIDKYIYASSVYVHGKYGGFYKTSKQCAELFIKNYNLTYNLDYLILQFGTLYGDRSNRKNGIYNYLYQAINNNKIEYVGSKNSIRNYINVLDAAKVCVDLVKNKIKNKTFIINGKQERKITDTFMLIEEILERKLKFLFKKPKLLNHYEITPYTSQDEVPINYTINKSIDFGFGIKKLINSIKKNENKDDNL